VSRTLRRFYRHGLLPQLFVFEAVARLGSVTRAAEELHLAQPTVSLQLKKLAAALEVTLFEQRGRQLHLTAAGQALREVCDELTHCLVRADRKLEAFRRPKRATLNVAAEPELRQVASRLVADFCVRHPGVQVRLHVADRVELFQRLSAGADDLALFELDVESLPAERRWSVHHAKGRPLPEAATLFLRHAMQLDAPGAAPKNPLESEENGEWRRHTTRR
jgi:LysR family transcriptional regulator, low CO2-responsive transcriptional regulator